MYDVKPITSPRQLDCGATCLQMLLNYYGIEEELNVLTKKVNTRIVGCNAKDIKRVLEEYNLDPHVYKMDVDELINQDRPSIVWWKGNHFCVCCGIDRNENVVICNPDRGRYRMPKHTFEVFYTGIAIFSGEPQNLKDPQTLSEEVNMLRAQNEMLTECLLELADIIYA